MNKKSTFRLLALAGLLAAAPTTMSAQTTEPASASKVVYDFKGFDDVKLLKLFAKIVKEGRRYPTDAELRDAGLANEIEFVRSHVRKHSFSCRPLKSNNV